MYLRNPIANRVSREITIESNNDGLIIWEKRLEIRQNYMKEKGFYI